MADDKHILRITLNGTNLNPYAIYGLRHNPFPRIADATVMPTRAEIAINSLEGEPLSGPEDIRERLKGFTEEFIALCVEKFKLGESVSFTVHWPRR